MSSPKRRTALVLGGEPRVELLPPEIALRGKAASLRRAAALGVLVAVVAVVGGYALAALDNANTRTALAAAQARSSVLVAEQQKFAEVGNATALADDIVAARAIGASTEVLWSGLMAQTATKLPAGVTVESATMKSRSPWESTLAPAGPLRQPRVGSASIVLASHTIFDATTVVRGLQSIPGYADASPDALTFEGDRYLVTITFDVGDPALSGRFTEDAEASK